MSVKTTKGAGGGLGGSKKKRGTAITSLAGLLQKHVGLRDSSAKYQKSFVCLRTMCLMCYESVRLKETTTSQCRQLKLNPLSTQINIRRLMNNQTPALLVQRAPWTRAAVMLLQSPNFSRFLPNHPRSFSSLDTHSRWPLVTQSARSRRSYGKIGDCEKSSAQRSTMSKKIWLSMHTRNLEITWPYVFRPHYRYTNVK